MSGYPSQLIYYMWGFQVHFKISCQVTAEAIFNHLDRGLYPSVMMVGFNNDHDNNRPKICFEPENADYLLSDFDSWETTAESIFKNMPERNLLYSGDGMQEEMELRHFKRGRKLAVEKILNSSKNSSENLYFVSNSVTINQYDVYIILSLRKAVYHSHNHLHSELFQDQFKIHKSLLETATESFLADCEQNLSLPNPGKSLRGEGRNSNELLRDAARNFMYTISSRGKAFDGLHGLFENCNTISTHKYEGKENLGQLIITSEDNPHIDFILRLEEPFKLSDFRKATKMLQLTDEKVGVVCNSYQVLGLGKISDYDVESESVFIIRFTGIHCWEVSHDSKQLMIMKYGLPYFPSEVIEKKIFISDCNRLFPDISDAQIDNLYTLAVAATKQRNGALLIVSDDAKNEATRLAKQSIAIQSFKLTVEMLVTLSAIDGGVLIDRNGMVYAQGVILDGIVNNKGDSARGSRYNSAVTYYEFKASKTPTLLVVVSEDGMVDIIPSLKPMVKHSEILATIQILENLKEDFDQGIFDRVMFWFINREFYLTDEECTKINSLKTELDESNPIIAMKIIHRDLSSNPEMNASYYLSEE